MRLSLSVVRNMRLLDGVRLIESEILAPPIIGTYVRALNGSSTGSASYELSDS